MIARLLLVATLLFILTACGSLAGRVKPGDAESAVLSSAGRPTASYPLSDGGKRLQYSGQPWNQSVWNIDLDPQGRVVRVEQMMSDAAFAHIRSGADTRSDVQREFGPPAYVYAFPMKDETAYMYRYFDSAGWYAAMFVYFDPAGTVTRTETGMDPWRLRGGSDRGR